MRIPTKLTQRRSSKAAATLIRRPESTYSRVRKAQKPIWDVSLREVRPTMGLTPLAMRQRTAPLTVPFLMGSIATRGPGLGPVRWRCQVVPPPTRSTGGRKKDD